MKSFFKKSKFLTFLLLFVLVLTAAKASTSGTFVSKGEGYGGDIKLEVVIADNQIKDIKVISHNETKGIGDNAIELLPKRIVENQSIEVDSVAGATVTSTGIKNAVKKSLETAKLDVTLFSKKIELKKEPQAQIDKEADLIIIGAGGAGFAAGVSAYENGATSVIILEKMPIIGGNTVRSGGALNAVNPPKQLAQGVEDSTDRHFNDTFDGGNKVANPDLVRTMVNNATDAVNWLEKLGMKWMEKIGSVIGSMWTRTNQSTDPLGTGFINTLSGAFDKHGGKVYVNTKAESLIKKDGRIIGVTAIDAAGNKVEFIAKKGVIIATGGYGANINMVKQYLDKGVYTKDNLSDNVESTNHPGATGDGIIMAMNIGGATVDLQHVQLLPMPADKFGPTINIDDVIFVNKDGKRYVKEDGRRDELCLATFAQKDGQYYMINDSKIIPKNRKTLSNEDLDTLISRGIVIEANTLEELAKKINIPFENLKETVDKFNISVDKNQDEFGRKIWGKKIDKGPFYATFRYPALHHTMGGIKIDNKARVLDNSGKPIPGLFAAGEVTGGIHGANRLGGNALTDIIVFGRIAGKTAVAK